MRGPRRRGRNRLASGPRSPSRACSDHARNGSVSMSGSAPCTLGTAWCVLCLFFHQATEKPWNKSPMMKLAHEPPQHTRGCALRPISAVQPWRARGRARAVHGRLPCRVVQHAVLKHLVVQKVVREPAALLPKDAQHGPAQDGCRGARPAGGRSRAIGVRVSIGARTQTGPRTLGSLPVASVSMRARYMLSARIATVLTN